MLNLFVLLVCAASTLAKQTCNAEAQEKLKDRGVSKGKQDEFVFLFNDHRNKVAVGKSKNWENKFQTSAFMNYIKWDHKLAQKAQECADVCPNKFTIDCSHIIQNQLGFVWFAGDVWNGGAEWHINQIMSTWKYDREMSRQLELGDATIFGCGRSQIERKRIASEAVVCLFDRKPKMNGPVYKEGMPGNSCPHGLKKDYLGLCRLSHIENALLTHHHQHGKKHHAHSDYQ